MATAHGKLVNVHGKNMHIRQMGDGEKVIILLLGWNVPLPSVEFAPLMRAISKKHTVCLIEFFGYGHSDSTERPHTNDNYMQEIRTALSLSGLKPPYVLMPYSCAGIYCEYYAAKYPNEVESIIMLDCTSTAEEMDATTQEELDEMMNIHNETPAMDIEDFTEADIKEYYDAYLKYGYTKEELGEIATVPNHAETLIGQLAALHENVQEVMAMDFPSEIPILYFASEIGIGCEGDEIEESRKDLAEGRKIHIDKLGAKCKEIVIKGSNHSDIYYYSDVICKEIDDFL
jgi:pimeloyl-ACP methyl ester carboxylesterase